MKFPIHDLLIRPLELHEIGNSSRIPVYRFDDHILSQLRYAEFIHLPPGYEGSMDPRTVADELWALLEGKIAFAWVDERPDSPSFESKFKYESESPMVALVPFGVAFRFSAGAQGASLLRVSSDQPEATLEDGDLRVRHTE